MTVLLQFDTALIRDALSDNGSARGARWQGSSNPFEWYCDWASRCVDSLLVLIPEDLEEQAEQVLSHLKDASPLWYADHTRLCLPEMSRKEQVWLINGDHFPLVDWLEAASVARQADADLVVFGPPDSADVAQYHETVAVDDAGEVLRFSRDYSDSPAFTDFWTGSASFVATTSEHAPAVMRHILRSGWGLDSIGALTRRFSIRWSTDSCLASCRERPQLRVEHDANGSLAVTAVAGEVNGGSSNETPTFTPSLTMPNTPVLPDEADDLPRAGRLYLIAKRSTDILLACVGLIVLSPLLAAAALAVRLTSSGPILFGDKRQGMGGREFMCWKFRTMCHGAQRMQAQLRAQNEVDGPQFKITADPRLTCIGVFYRRYNIDELPQIMNVLLGQMSFVGPRPSPDHENQMCPGWRRTRLSMRPGITGLWQIMRLRDASDSGFQEWIYYDVEYARHRSMWLDMQILLHTPLVMFAPRLLARFPRTLRRRGICLHAGRLT